MEREKGGYCKQSDWWQERIHFVRKAKKDRIKQDICEVNNLYTSTQNNENHASVNVEGMDTTQLKELLNKNGIKTRFKRRDKLLNLVKENNII